MWIRFKNDVTVNMSAVIKYEKTLYGHGIIFYCNGLGFTLSFESDKHRTRAIELIEEAIKNDHGFYEIDIVAKPE